MSKSNKKFINDEDVKIKENRKALNKRERRRIKQYINNIDSEEIDDYVDEFESSGLYRGWIS